MEINKRDRSALKSYFVEFALPSEDNFGELIDGMINQKDDGVVKQPGSPLSLQASGDASSSQKVLNLYSNFSEPAPTWTLSLRPRSDPGNPATGRAGLSFATSNGVSRLFLDHGTGRVGVGTVDPQAGLHVATDARIDGAARLASDAWIEGDARVVGDMHVEGRASIEAQEDWREFEFHNGWAADDNHVYDNKLLAGARFMKDSMGFVRFRGRLKAGTHQHMITMCTLPEGYRPAVWSIYLVYTNTSKLCGTVDIAPAGEVRHGNNLGSGVELGTISFQAAPVNP